MAKKKRSRTAPTSPTSKTPPAAADPSTEGAEPRVKPRAANASSNLGRQRRGRRKGTPLPWILALGGLAALVAIQVGMNVIRERNAPGDRFASQGNVHVALGTSTPAYNSEPPTSGWHTPDLAAWGSYVEPLPDQRVIHNMEDGGVVLWYEAGTPAENEAHVDALESVVGGRYPRVVIVPREDMPTTYALTAWQRLARFDEIDVDGMQAFLAAYHGIDNH
jgi:hypothetical protein